MPHRRIAIVLTAILAAGAAYSYLGSGFVYVLVSGVPGEAHWLERVRGAVAAWGPLAPVVYTLVVVIEVVVAPIPGALLYAPGGAIFGAFMGGTLSLVGNVIGAALCCVLGGMIGERIVGKQSQSPQFARYQQRLAARGLWVVLLLRANPLTSSDLVSYAAGIASVPPWKVAVGTLVGLAPLCYLQAYFAERVFTLVPGRILILSSLAVAAIVVLVLIRKRGD